MATLAATSVTKALAAPELLAAQQAHQVVRSKLTEDEYTTARAVTTWGYSAAIGFLPLNIITFPFQLAMIVFFTILFLVVFDFGFFQTVLAAYITQGIIVTLFVHFFLDTGIKILL